VRRTGCCRTRQLLRALCQRGMAIAYLLTQRLQLVSINVLPDPLHILPIRHDPMLEWVLYLQQPPQLLRSVPNERISLQPSRQHPQMLRSADEGREVALGQILSSISSSDGAAAVVDDDGRVVKVGHGIRALVSAVLER
jgi:hypothetical protein